MTYTFATATILLILITDPIGNIPVFANALKPVAPARRPWPLCCWRRRPSGAWSGSMRCASP